MTFIGRELELDRLTRATALAMELPSGRTIFVEGPPGAGKSALVAEFLERLAGDHPELTIARGRCLQTFGSADPYLPFVNAITDLSDERTPGHVRSREALSSLLTELAPYWLSVVPLVGGVLSAGFATASRLRGQGAGDAAPSREALFVQYLEVIKGLARDGPLVLYLDDLHWSDQASVALLAHLSRSIARLPVVILATLRDIDAELEKHPVLEVIRELEREGLAEKIQLEDLPHGSLPALMSASFGGDISAPLLRWMQETAGGNPLFVGELARLLNQSGGAVARNGEWLLTDAVREIDVPRSAEAVIESRIGRLEGREIRVLQYASVEGNEFNSRILAELLDEDELGILDVLETLDRVHALVQAVGETDLPDGDIATTYRFRHALVQTVLYRQVVGKRRILLHRRAAEVLEALFRDSLDDVAGKLARHFRQGRQREPAHRFACRAAQRARLVYAHWEAEEYLRLALENSSDEADRAELEEALGDVYDVVGYYSSGIQCYRQSLEKRSHDHAASLRLRRKTVVLERKAGLMPAPALLQQIRDLLAQALEQPEERCYLLLETSMLPDAVGVVDAVEEAVELAESRGDPLLVLDTLERLAFVLIFFGGRVEEALPHLQRALDIANQLGDPLRSARSHEIQAIAYARLGRYSEALAEFRSLLGMAERLGEPQRIGSACNNIGHVLLRLGQYQEAEEILQRARVTHERRDRASLVQSLLNLAERARRSGDLALAVQRYGQLLESAREFEYWTSEAIAQAGLGRSLLEAGDIAAARDAAAETAALIADHDDWFEDREYIEIFLARMEALGDDADRALQRLTSAAGALAASDVYLWASVEVERARILGDSDPEMARAIIARVAEATAGLQSALAADIQRLQQALTPAADPGQKGAEQSDEPASTQVGLQKS